MSNNTKQNINYILIDYENVQPSSLKLPKNNLFKIIVFVGANQTKIPIKFSVSMQNLGSNAEYIVMEGTGKNALDFHLVFYLGKIYEKDPKGSFHIITKDTNFDLLIKHLKEKGASINRYDNINKIPILKQTSCTTLPIDKKIDFIVDYLIKRGNAKPKKVESLSNVINSICNRGLNSNQIDTIIKTMVKKRLITINENKIAYTQVK